MKTSIEVKTKPDARSTAITTALTINWEDMSQDDLIALAQQALVVKLQSNWRNNTIPEGEHEIKAVDYKVGVRGPRGPVDPLAAFKKMSPEEQAAFLAKVQALQQG